jgi:CRISPR-associated endonuclease Cas1
VEILTSADRIEPDDDTAWAERAQYWESLGSEPSAEPEPFNAPRVEQPPLVLNGHGVRLHIHNGCLLIRNGFTHYPQQNEELRFFPGDRKLPSRIIALENDGSITFDVIAWLAQQRVSLVLIDWRGHVVSMIGDGSVYDPDLRQKQIEAQTNGAGLELATQLIREKVEGEQETLFTLFRTPARDNGLRKLEAIRKELDRVPESFEVLRLIEARAALAYFLCWQEVPLQWKGTGRKPIPLEWHRAGLRSGLLQDGTNRHATHPVNAMLNYAYAVLESQVRIAAVAHGLDPMIGYLHVSKKRRVALVYDLMEPLRPRVDRRVLDFAREHTFSPSDFVMTPKGVCRLHPQLIRHVTLLGTYDCGLSGFVQALAPHGGC